jgi:hypothetical protein
VQLFTLSIFIFILACIGIFYPYNRGGLYTALIGGMAWLFAQLCPCLQCTLIRMRSWLRGDRCATPDTM